MQSIQALSISGVILALASCGGGNEGNYAKAAIGAGAMIAAVGVNRAVTKECWGQCSSGYACNEKSGLCERGECLPGCAVGTHCVRDARDITYCARDTKPPTSPKNVTANAPTPQPSPTPQAPVDPTLTTVEPPN